MAKKIEFDMPDGLSLPEGVDPDGGEFDVLARIKSKDGGKRGCLVALDEYRMPGYKEGDEKDSDDGKSYAEAASEGMEGGY